MCSPEDHLIAHGLLWPTLAHLRQLCSAPSFSYFLFQHRARSHCKCRQNKTKQNSNIKLFVLISHIYFPPGWAGRRHEGSCPTLNPAGWADSPSCFEPHLTSSMPPQQLGFLPPPPPPFSLIFFDILHLTSSLFLFSFCTPSPIQSLFSNKHAAIHQLQCRRWHQASLPSLQILSGFHFLPICLGPLKPCRLCM